MIWDNSISFEGFSKKIDDCCAKGKYIISEPPVEAQYALDLIFRTLIDDKEHYSYLTAMPVSTKQVNSIMLHLILKKYSRKYRKHLKKIRARRGGS